MKKITLSVAALALAINSYAQHAKFDPGITTIVSKYAYESKKVHENLYEVVIKAEDMIAMLRKDITDGHIDEYYTIFYKDLLTDIISLTHSYATNDSLGFENPKVREKVYKKTELNRE